MNLTVLGLLVGASIAFCPMPMAAQAWWLDTVPSMRVGCVSGQGSLNGTDFTKLLSGAAKAGGATDIGFPYLTSLGSTPGGASSLPWKTCALVKGPVQSQGDLTVEDTTASSAAFLACAGTDSVQCSAQLLTSLKAKLPDFSGIARIEPFWNVAADQLASVKPMIQQLLNQTFPLAAQAANSSTRTIEGIDQQLKGTNMTPRPLLTDSAVVGASVPTPGGNQPPTGLLVYFVLSPAQQATLTAP